jgi:hypothetical protein
LIRNILLLSACVWLAACSSKPDPSPVAKERPPALPKIRQFYTTTPQLPRGETGMLCYGVEGAKSVWLSPPRQELTASLTRCIEVKPTETTVYTLTAQNAAGAEAMTELKIEVGAPQPPAAKIIEVQFTALKLKRGDTLGICYVVQNAASVEIAPIKYKGSGPKGCTSDQPQKTTSYTVTAIGQGGGRDQEKVTVTVR